MANRLSSGCRRSTPARISVLTMIALLTLSSMILYVQWQPQHFVLPDVLTSKPSSNPFKLNPERYFSRDATTLTYRWRITSEERRPDGVLKRILLINGHFPGPTIEARPGDQIIVEVENALIEENEGVSIHWHGLTMRGCNDMDGAAGITQSPIRSGEIFKYEFQIADDQCGTFWYHAHSAVQRADGLYGGLIVHSLEQQTPNPPDEYLLMIGDWYHRTADEVLAWYLTADSFGMEPVPDSILVNGQGVFDCTDAVPARPVECISAQQKLPFLQFDASKTSLLRVINVGSYTGFSLSFNGAQLEVLTVDGGNKVVSTVSDTIDILYPGERIGLLVNDWVDVNSQLSIILPTKRYKYSNPALKSKQSFEVSLQNYKHMPKPTIDEHPAEIALDQLKASSSDSIPSAADVVLLLYTMTEKLAHLDYVPHGNINRTIWAPQSPHLLNADPDDWDDHQFIPHIPYHESQPLWVDLVINNLDEEDHPFHLHGHDFYVMSTYSSSKSWGSYNPFDQYDPPGGAYASTPLRKDTVAVPRRGYAVLRFEANNPGIWMFHCHVIWHLASGMAMGLDVS